LCNHQRGARAEIATFVPTKFCSAIKNKYSSWVVRLARSLLSTIASSTDVFANCSKVYFLNPRRKGKLSRRICVCVPHCPDENIDDVQQLSAYYIHSGVKLCRYDILVDDYRKHYGNDGTTSVDDISCPDLPRTAG